jgi:regulatory protein
VRALRNRDRSSAQLDRHLADRGFDEDERCAALETLVRTGILDDGRYAENRARGLTERGAGDVLVRHDLRDAGISDDEIERALDLVPPEPERAERIVERRGASVKTARYLSARGFSDDAVRAAVAHAVGEG